MKDCRCNDVLKMFIFEAISYNEIVISSFCVHQLQRVLHIMFTEGVDDVNASANWTLTAGFSSQSSLQTVQVFLGGVSVLALLGNGLVCVGVMRNRKILRSAHNRFLFNLAMTDFFTGKGIEK